MIRDILRHGSVQTALISGVTTVAATIVTPWAWWLVLTWAAVMVCAVLQARNAVARTAAYRRWGLTPR